MFEYEDSEEEILDNIHRDGALSLVNQGRDFLDSNGGFGIKVGETLTEFSFLNFGALNQGAWLLQDEEANVDLDNSWVKRAVNKGVKNDLLTIPYAIHAAPGGKLDIKAHAPPEIGQQRTATLLYTKKDGTPVYATARDGGNFIAGIFQQDSWATNRLISSGFGSLNVAQTRGPSWQIPFRMVGLVGGRYLEDIFGSNIFESSLQPPYYGEDIGTGAAILEGRNFHAKTGWDTSFQRKSINPGMGLHAGRSAKYPIKTK